MPTCCRRSADDLVWLAKAHGDHDGRLLLFGDAHPLAFCGVCGFYAEAKLRQLKFPCKGLVSAFAAPSRHYQLSLMARGLHPTRNAPASSRRRAVFGRWLGLLSTVCSRSPPCVNRSGKVLCFLSFALTGHWLPPALLPSLGGRSLWAQACRSCSSCYG